MVRERLLGWMPRGGGVDKDGLEDVAFDAAPAINTPDVRAELVGHQDLFLKLAGDLPKEIIFQRELLVSRL